MKLVSAFVAGLVFAVGLGISGMTLPSRVLGFLDVTGAWDPSLALVMAGAIAVHLVPSLWTWRRGRALLDARLHGPTRARVDAKLLGGAAIFGVGWGMAGYCPGPAVVTASIGAPPALVFVAAMVAGMAVAAAAERARDGASARRARSVG